MYLLWLSGGLILTYLLNIIFVYVADHYPSVRSRRVTQERWNTAWKPNVGGSSFVLLLWIGILGAYLYGKEISVSLLLGASAATFGYLHGLLDDHYTITPKLKLAGQLVCATLLWMGGVQIHYFNDNFLDGCLTFFWVIGLMNSINMLDNMDGITGSVSVSILVITNLFLYQYGLMNDAVFMVNVVLIGCLIGFLMLNFHPAKLFMGDKGSQFLGVFLAYLGIEYFWNARSEVGLHWFQSGIIPILIFMIPILDTSFVTVVRLSQGKSPAQGGRDHTTHHWAYIGIPQKAIAIGYLFISLIAGYFAYMIRFEVKEWNIITTWICLTLISVVVLVFLWGYRKGFHAKNTREQSIMPTVPTPVSGESKV